jgi:hypothetical protein
MALKITPTEIPPLERNHLRNIEFFIVEHNLAEDYLYEHWEANFDDDFQRTTFTFEGRTCITEASECIYRTLNEARYIGLAYAEGEVIKVQYIPAEISNRWLTSK